MRHAEVIEALELVAGEVGQASQAVRSAGGEALTNNKLQLAKRAIALAERLEKFVDKVNALGDEWAEIQKEIEGASPEVKEVVLPTKVRKTKTGYTRKVETVAPKTNFKVTFPDGTVVADKKAKNVFAKSLTRLGADKVAALGIVMAGEPLVAKSAAFKKTPSQIAPLGGGLFVNTHSSTATKVSLLTKISARLGVKVKIEQI